MIPQSEISHFVKTRPDEFEQMLLVAIVWKEKLFRQVRSLIATRKSDETLFRNSVHEAIYRAIESINGIIVDSGNELPQGYAIAPQMLQQQLNSYAEQARYIASSQIPQAMQIYWDAWQAHYNPHATFMVEAGWRTWMLERSQIQILTMALRNQDVDVSKELSDVHRAVAARDDNNKMQSLQQTALAVDEPIVRIPTGFIPLDRKLGGGFGKSEGILVLGPSGCGKSVFSSQISYGMSKQGVGHSGLLIHTEMQPKDYSNRIIASQCHIPYGAIKDGFSLNNLNQRQVAAYEALMADMNTKWLRYKWKDVNHQGIFTMMDDLLKQAQDEMGGLDHAHLDWLGGALNRSAAGDPAMLRMLYQTAADAGAELADRHKIVFVVYAQAHPAQAKNKKRVGPELACECKSLHREMTTAIGISAIELPADTSASPTAVEEVSYQDVQYLYLGKSRKSEGGCIPFKRRFDQMRMDYF